MNTQTSTQNILESEKKKLVQLINIYVRLERDFSHREQEIKFYTQVTSLFFTEHARKDVPDKEYQLKPLRDVRKRFFKNYSPTNRKLDSSDFHKYFYNKFTDEIRNVRKQKTGVAFSQRSAIYRDRLVGRA